MGARDPTEGTMDELLRETEIEKQNVQVEKTKRQIETIKRDLNSDAVEVLTDIIETRMRAERVRSKAMAVDMVL